MKIDRFIKGMDVSTVIEEEACGARFFKDGKEDDLFNILKEYGTNSIRIRLWNDPYDENKNPYGAGTNDYEKVVLISRRAKEAGMSTLLDFHYSDFWADPGKQILPKAWKDYNEDQLADAVYTYTKKVLLDLKEENLLPDMVQVGNEITNGLLWPTGLKPNFDQINRYVSAGLKAVKEVSKDIITMIHLDNGGNAPMYKEWFDEYFKRDGEDFDVIGLSYYPFWHGTKDDLKANMLQLSSLYGKEMIIDEVSTGFSMEDYSHYEGLKAEERKGYATKEELVAKVPYPMTKEGQAAFMKDIMELIVSIKGGRGFYYWEPAWIPVPGCGWASDAALEYTKEKGPGGNEWANQALFDYEGNSLPALAQIRDFDAEII